MQLKTTDAACQYAGDESTFSRRELLRQAPLAAGGLSFAAVAAQAPVAAAEPSEQGVILNDVQSQLNSTRVHKVLQPQSVDDLSAAVKQARRAGRAISVAGGRHSMGAQQFGTDNLHLDMTSFHRVLELDRGVLSENSGVLSDQTPIRSRPSISKRLVSALCAAFRLRSHFV